MKVSINWLREFVEVPADVPALCELLTLAGVEVEGIETRGVESDKIVVAQILASEQHPNADRLSVCRVNDGSGTERQIVCGAKNYNVGDKVPLAQLGAVLPGDFKIKVGKLRGVESQGMLCSAAELNMAAEADGLLILPSDAVVGTPLREMFPAETILDVEVTPNRPDLLSHIGIAREVAALSKKELTTNAPDPVADEKSGGIPVTLDAGEDCPFYTARRISGVTVGPSPAWLQRKLEAVGLRAINNVVDVTNYVMLEMGQPLHAFDAAKVVGGIRVRHAADSEQFLALDGKLYPLRTSHMVIADEAKALAIAGVMGGEDSGVTETTTDVILESAWFRPASVRRTARELGLGSDSSYRFERGIDPGCVEVASLRAARLLAELAGGKIETFDAAGAPPVVTGSVTLRPGRCSEVAGGEISETEIAAILERLGLRQNGDAWVVPSFRADLAREIDLVEEVVRIFGIENIPARLRGTYVSASAADAIHDRCGELRRVLAATGFYEARNVSLISNREAAEDPLATTDLRPLKNPMSEDQTVLRPNLLPGLLRVLGHNIRAGGRDFRFFEIGRVFRSEERLHLALVMMGAAQPASWREASPNGADFFDLKGVIAGLGLGEVEFVPAESASLPLASRIVVNGIDAGIAGQLLPAAARALDAGSPVMVAEIDLSALPLTERTEQVCREINRFPAVSRDVALVAPHSVSHSELSAALSGANEPLLESVKLFDVFADPTGAKIPADQKSLAYSLTYRANDRTLTADEVNAAHGRLKERLKAVPGVQLRE